MTHPQQTILIIGSPPPPYGGVSIHIQRLTEYLQNEGFSCIVIDPVHIAQAIRTCRWRRLFKTLQTIVATGDAVVHIHTSGLNLSKTLIFPFLSAIPGKKSIVTLHSLRTKPQAPVDVWKALLRASMSPVSHFIAVSELMKDDLLEIAPFPEKISVIPAFLPPIPREQDYLAIPDSIWNFMDRHETIISSNAYRITFHNQQDLYGIDMCIEICSRLRQKGRDTGFVFCLPQIGEPSYFSKLQDLVRNKGLSEHFLFVTEPLQFYPLLERSTLYVRPTNTDGDSISVREALHFQIPVVASDAVPRPQGVTIFKNRDINGFSRTVEHVLDTTGSCRPGRLHYEHNNGKRIVQLYHQILENDMDI